MKINKRYLWISIVLILIGTGYYKYTKSKTANSQATYLTSEAKRGSLTTSVTGSGNVIVDQLATVDPTISGTVTGLSVKIGDEVKKGQKLFVISNEDLSVNVAKSDSALQQAQNSVDSAQLQIDQAKADYDSAKKKDKIDSSAYTSKQLDVMKDKIDIAEAGVIAAEKNLLAIKADNNNQRSNASERVVTAPISGTISELNIKNGDDLGKIGNSSTSGKVSPIVIGDLKTLKAQVQINEVDIPNVKIGQKATLNFSAIDDLEVSGLVEKIDALGTITQGVVNYNVTVDLDSLDSRIRPQMSVSASIITDVKQNVITIPNGALKNSEKATYVEVLLANNSVEKRKIEIGSANNKETEIVSGVNQGDKVITQTIDPNKKTNSPSSGGKSGTNNGFHMPGFGIGGSRG